MLEVDEYNEHADVVDERHIQRTYWTKHSADLSVECMMLDSNASDLDKEEIPEVRILFLYHLLLTYFFV